MELQPVDPAWGYLDELIVSPPAGCEHAPVYIWNGCAMEVIAYLPAGTRVRFVRSWDNGVRYAEALLGGAPAIMMQACLEPALVEGAING